MSKLFLVSDELLINIIAKKLDELAKQHDLFLVVAPERFSSSRVSFFIYRKFVTIPVDGPRSPRADSEKMAVRGIENFATWKGDRLFSNENDYQKFVQEIEVEAVKFFEGALA